MAMVTLLAGTVAFTTLYNAAFEEERARLVETAAHQARLMEAIARFDEQTNLINHPEGVAGATLIQMRDAHAHDNGFGRTGELNLAKFENEHVVWLLSHRHHDAFGSQDRHAPVPMGSTYAEPMQRALLGQTGTMIGRDYRGEEVLAAYTPVKGMKFGIVAKIDMAEIHAPYIRAGLFGLGGGFGFIALGTILFTRITNPLIAELEEREDKIRLLLNSAAEAIVGIDTEGKCTFVNAVGLKILGHSSVDNFVGKNIHDLIHHSYADGTPYPEEACPMSAILKTGKMIHGDNEVLWRANGTSFLSEYFASPIHRGDKVIGAVVNFQDITELKQTEAELRRMSKVFQEATDPIIIEDLEGKVIDLNEEAVRAYGWTRMELLGKPIKTLVPAERYEQADELLHRCRSGEEVRNVEGLRISRKGRIFAVLLTLSLLTDEAGTPIGIATLAKDITALKQAEAQLRTKTQELENANLELQEADHHKSIFLAGLSHELRTPLNSIIGFAGILLQGLAGPLNDEQKTQLGMVKTSGHHLLSLITDLLDISKIEAGKAELSCEEFLFNDIVGETVQSVATMAHEKGLEIFTDVSPGLNMFSDKRRVKQIFLNLLSNAVKYTDKGHIKIRAGLAAEERLNFSILDTGIGIKNEEMKDLFEPFMQVGTKLTKKHEGTGLGLFLAKKLVILLHGEIQATSEYARSSEFTVVLPLRHRDPTHHETNPLN